jgi:ABC-type sugar transport system permease subunit
MIISYVIGFFATFVVCALYNQQCKAGEEINMVQAVITSLVWPMALLFVVLMLIWKVLEKIFNSISKK